MGREIGLLYDNETYCSSCKVKPEVLHKPRNSLRKYVHFSWRYFGDM